MNLKNENTEAEVAVTKLDAVGIQVMHVKADTRMLMEDFLDLMSKPNSESVIFNNCGIMYDMHGMVTSIIIAKQIMDDVTLGDTPLDQVLTEAFVNRDFDSVSIDIMFQPSSEVEAFTETIEHYFYHNRNIMNDAECDCPVCSAKASEYICDDCLAKEAEQETEEGPQPEVDLDNVQTVDDLLKTVLSLVKDITNKNIKK